MPAEMLPPKNDLNPKLCIWSDFSLKQIDKLKSIQATLDIKQEIADILHLENFTQNSKSSILVDLYYFAFTFSRDCNFNEEQISAFLSIIKRTHDKAVETPFGNVDSTFDYFKDLLLRHCVKRPPFSIQIFNVAEAKKITDYMLDTYFRHFKLYKYAFTPKIRLNLSVNYLGLPETQEELPEISAADAFDMEIKVEDAMSTAQQEIVEIEDPPAVRELKTMISSTLTDELQKLKMNVDQQLKSNEEALLKKISEATGNERSSSRRSRKK